MKANEFVQAHGLKRIKDIISKYGEYTHVTDDARMFINENQTTDYIKSQLSDVVKVSDLKRLVESHEIIEKYNINRENINWMFSKLDSNARHRIMQAWKDVESCK